MATGSTYDFAQSRDELISDALSKLGALRPDETPSGTKLLHAARALNRVVKSIDPEGNFLWRVVERTGTTTDGTAYIDPAADVIAVDEPINFKRSGEDGRTPLRAMSRDDYMRIPDRVAEGAPTHYYVVKTLTQPVRIYLSPTPDATGDTVTYSAILRSFDFDAGTNTPDFPVEWTQCLLFGLVADLAADYKQMALGVQFRQWFLEEKRKLLEAGTEHGNLTLVPWGAGGYY